MVKAICREGVVQKDYLTDPVSTIYFGGGTPSILKMEELQLLLHSLHQNYTITPDAEITLEANPDDINVANLTHWQQMGINRLSIGIQSFQDADLLWMNRLHNTHSALKALELATHFFNNITIDLIYGSPLLTDEDWLYNLHTASSFNIPHISCYALTVEPNTALHKMIDQHKKENIDAEKQSRHFDILCSWARKNCYEHYEISNFAKKGFRSKHNSSYWKGVSYLGLGPSAHSFNGTSRRWNIANNALYIRCIEQNDITFEEEVLTPVQQLNEAIMIQLRTIEGIDFNDARWMNIAYETKQKIFSAAQKWANTNHVIIHKNGMYLSDKGKFFADGIAADLFQ